MNKKMNKNKKGLTLIESMIALAAAGTITAVALSNKFEDFKRSEILSLIHSVSSVSTAVDHRIAIDGYSMDGWGLSSKDNTLPLKWTNIDLIVSDLIKNELVSKDLKSCSGDWTPRLNVESETKLLNCNLWSSSKPEGFNLSSTLTPDSHGFIKSFDTVLSFTDEESFKENYKNIKYAISNLNNNNKQFIKGHHKIELVSLSSGNSIFTTDCVQNYSDCGVKIGFKIDLDSTDDGYYGGEEFVRIDGGNSIIANNLTFMKSGLTNAAAEAPYKCIEWKLDSLTNIWSDELVECGIGIYEGSPTTVSVKTQTASFNDHITLKNKCKLFEKAADNTIKSDSEIPCGIIKNNNGIESVIQVVEKKVSEMAYFKELYSDQGYFNEISEVSLLEVEFANINDLIVDELNADVLNIINDLRTDSLSTSEFNGITTTITGEATFNKNQDFNNKVNFKEDLTFRDNSISLNGSVNSDENTVLNSNNVILKKIDILDKVTGTEVELSNIETNTLNINDNAILKSETEMKANTGDFDNINTELNILKHYVENNIYVVTQNTNQYDSWKNSGGIHSCGSWTPSTSVKPKGQRFTQTRTCKQNQIVNEYFYEHWKNQKGVVLKTVYIGHKQHSKTVNLSQSRTATGTKTSSSGGGRCSSKCSSAPSRQQYDLCMRSCSQHNGGGGNPGCGANGCGLGNAGGNRN